MTHCPLCIQPIAPFTNKPPLIIFLDMEGVLFDRDSESEAVCSTINKQFTSRVSQDDPDLSYGFTRKEWGIVLSQHLKEEPTKHLSYLINKISQINSVRIVLSSYWRNTATLQEIQTEYFTKYEFRKLIIGKTPPDKTCAYAPENKEGLTFEHQARKNYGLSLVTRGEQIDFWLQEHGIPKANCVIFDDVDWGISERFGDRFIHVDPKICLSKENVDQACRILKINDIAKPLLKGDDSPPSKHVDTIPPVAPSNHTIPKLLPFEEFVKEYIGPLEEYLEKLGSLFPK